MDSWWSVFAYGIANQPLGHNSTSSALHKALSPEIYYQVVFLKKISQPYFIFKNF